MGFIYNSHSKIIILVYLFVGDMASVPKSLDSLSLDFAAAGSGWWNTEPPSSKHLHGASKSIARYQIIDSKKKETLLSDFPGLMQMPGTMFEGGTRGLNGTRSKEPKQSLVIMRTPSNKPGLWPESIGNGVCLSQP